jgi:hypothetical protein
MIADDVVNRERPQANRGIHEEQEKVKTTSTEYQKFYAALEKALVVSQAS